MGFHVLAIINSAVMNIGVHVALSDLVSSVCKPSLRLSYPSLLFFGTLIQMGISSLSPLPFVSLLFTADKTTILPFCISFILLD